MFGLSTALEKGVRSRHPISNEGGGLAAPPFRQTDSAGGLGEEQAFPILLCRLRHVNSDEGGRIPSTWLWRRGGVHTSVISSKGERRVRDPQSRGAANDRRVKEV